MEHILLTILSCKHAHFMSFVKSFLRILVHTNGFHSIMQYIQVGKMTVYPEQLAAVRN